jgi:hypothetical protein
VWSEFPALVDADSSVLGILVRPLSGSEISVHFGCGLENGHSWQRFDDLKNFFDLRLQVHE